MCPRRPGRTGPGSRAPGAIGDRDARPRRPAPGAREGAPRPRTRARPSAPPPPAALAARRPGAVGNGADRQRGQPGAPGPGEDVRALHVHGQRALSRPPLRLCRRARHDVVHREEPSDPVAEPGGIEGPIGPAPETGIPAPAAEPPGDRHRIADDDVARPKIRSAPPGEPGHEHGGGPCEAETDVETVEQGRAGAHDPDGQAPAGSPAAGAGAARGPRWRGRRRRGHRPSRVSSTPASRRR